MNNPTKFIELIANFSGETIEQTILDNLQKILSIPGFNEEDMKSKNYAACKLCSWVVNIVNFNRIFKQVKPLVETKNSAIEQLEIKKKDLATIKEKVKILNEKVGTLKE